MGDVITELRLKARLSRAELADLADVSTEYIRKLENGAIHRPSLEYLSKIARAFGMSVHQLMSMGDVVVAGAEPTEDEGPHDPILELFESLAPGTPIQRLRRFVRLYGMLPPERQVMVERIMEVLESTPPPPADSAVPGERTGGGGRD